MKKVLHIGLSPPPCKEGELHVHCPMIQTHPKPLNHAAPTQAFFEWPLYSHVVITSKTAVPLLVKALSFYHLDIFSLASKTVIAVGQATAGALIAHGIFPAHIPKEESAEGIIDLLSHLPLEDSFFFLPRSAQGRRIIPQYLEKHNIPYKSCALYDTCPRPPDPNLYIDHFDEIVFTSPSCVDAFLHFYGTLPTNKTLTPIGPVTRKKLEHALKKRPLLNSNIGMKCTSTKGELEDN